jgi:hypothetical protein
MQNTGAWRHGEADHRDGLMPSAECKNSNGSHLFYVNDSPHNDKILSTVRRQFYCPPFIT